LIRVRALSDRCALQRSSTCAPGVRLPESSSFLVFSHGLRLPETRHCAGAFITYIFKCTQKSFMIDTRASRNHERLFPPQPYTTVRPTMSPRNSTTSHVGHIVRFSRLPKLSPENPSLNPQNRGHHQATPDSIRREIPVILSGTWTSSPLAENRQAGQDPPRFLIPLNRISACIANRRQGPAAVGHRAHPVS